MEKAFKIARQNGRQASFFCIAQAFVSSKFRFYLLYHILAAWWLVLVGEGAAVVQDVCARKAP